MDNWLERGVRIPVGLGAEKRLGAARVAVSRGFGGLIRVGLLTSKTTIVESSG